MSKKSGRKTEMRLCICDRSKVKKHRKSISQKMHSKGFATWRTRIRGLFEETRVGEGSGGGAKQLDANPGATAR